MNVNQANSKGETAAFYAMWSDHVGVLDRLIMAGADLHHRDEYGNNLWSHVVCPENNDKLEPNYRRIAECNVYLDKKVYHRTFDELYGEEEGKWLLAIMHEVAAKQGFETKGSMKK